MYTPFTSLSCPPSIPTGSHQCSYACTYGALVGIEGRAFSKVLVLNTSRYAEFFIFLHPFHRLIQQIICNVPYLYRVIAWRFNTIPVFVHVVHRFVGEYAILFAEYDTQLLSLIKKGTNSFSVLFDWTLPNWKKEKGILIHKSLFSLRLDTYLT